jgi:hypothetical protein
MALDPLAIIEKRESGGRNVPNYKYGPGFSASGHFQMIKGTWQRWAKAAGIDISKYPEAIDAPYDVQRKVAEYGWRTEGFKPWEATKHLVGQEANYSVTGGATGAAQPSITQNANNIPGGYIPSELPAGGLNAPAPPVERAGEPARTGAELEARLKEKFPYLRVTSRDRSAEHNAAVGGAKGSQHLHGNAIDIGMSELTPQQREEVTRYAISIGARGVGYYPNSNSMHFDTRPGAQAFWGPNYSKSSLGQTPDWFQGVAGGNYQTSGSTGAAYGERQGVNGIPGGYTPSELPAGGIAPAGPPGGVLGAPGTPAPVGREPPSAAPLAPFFAAPNSDAARMLSDPTRYGLSPQDYQALRAQMEKGGPGGGTIGNIPAPAPAPISPSAPPPAGVLSQGGVPPAPGAPPPSPHAAQPTAEERETTRKYLAGMGPGPIGIWNPEKIWSQRPEYAQPAKPLSEYSFPPNAVAQANQAPVIGERLPPPGAQGTAGQLVDDWRNKRPLGLFQGGWT